MSTKQELLSLLETRRGTYVSGEEIAAQLQVSRTAVWKAVNALIAEGYEIDGVRNRGYCLAQRTDKLSAEGIRRYLLPIAQGLQPETYDEVTSTNALLRQRAAAGAPEGCVILAGAQTQGRGRLGRSFYSPSDTGLYLSLLLRPVGFSPAQSVKVTTMAAVAACEAISEVAGREAQIKWVNDIILDDRKVSGILTEGAFNLETGGMDYIVLGIGINVYPPEGGFPEEIAGIAGAVFPERCSDGKNRLAAAFLNHFMECYAGEGRETYAERYRQKSLVIGRQINVITPTEQRRATALDVDSECRLIVRYEDGTVEALSSSEISIRPAQ